MKHLTLFLIFAIAGCSTPCALQFPLDGKAQSWCERKERAEKQCKKEGGVSDIQYGWSWCKSGKRVCVDANEYGPCEVLK